MISYNDKYFVKDGEVWFPIMGEYEYSRTERREWARGIAKMKALGINTVQCYCIWIHHEEIRGHFNFRGNKNLRAFIRLVKEAGMELCLRVGPWVHAEVRNGGFPDWIYDRPYTPRTCDAAYLADVERYFRELYRQCEGYLAKDGGPIFAVQVENEYKVSPAKRDEGVAYINSLISMLREIGFDVPVWFATAWGNAITGDAIPVWGEYCAAPWEQHTRALPPNEAYLIGNNPNNAAVGEYEDAPRNEGVNLGARHGVPYMTIEQGGGVQPTRLRRPLSRGRDNGAMALCRLAQGLAGFGYYVFHGGINPVGALASMQEYKNAEYTRTRGGGFFCDLAERNYDFQAPVSQYNRMKETGFELKLWNSFASEFCDVLLGADVELLPDNAKVADDFESPRYSVRRQGSSGFLFVNNFVRGYAMPERRLGGICIEADGERISFPELIVGDGEYAAFPFNLPFGSMTLKYATATPLCRLNGNCAVLFSENGTAEYETSGSGDVLLLSRREAEHAFKVKNGSREYIVVADGELYREGNGLVHEYTKDPVLKIYPRPAAIDGYEYVGSEGGLSVFHRLADERAALGISVREALRAKEFADFTVKLAYGDEKPFDAFLGFDFSADSIELFADGEKLNDMFYNGAPFEVSLRYYDFPDELTVRLNTLRETADVYLEKKPAYIDGEACSLDSVSVEVVSHERINIAN